MKANWKSLTEESKKELYQVMSKLTEKQTDSILKMILSLQNHA